MESEWSHKTKKGTILFLQKQNREVNSWKRKTKARSENFRKGFLVCVCVLQTLYAKQIKALPLQTIIINDFKDRLRSLFPEREKMKIHAEWSRISGNSFSLWTL
jgi:hypothetical protein